MTEVKESGEHQSGDDVPESQHIETLFQAQVQVCAVLNMEEDKTRPPKKRSKLRNMTQADLDLCLAHSPTAASSPRRTRGKTIENTMIVEAQMKEESRDLDFVNQRQQLEQGTTDKPEKAPAGKSQRKMKGRSTKTETSDEDVISAGTGDGTTKVKEMMKLPEQKSDEHEPSETLLKPESLSNESDKQEIDIKSKSGNRRGKRKASQRSKRASKVSKMEDTMSTYNPLLGSDSLIEDALFSNVDLSTIGNEGQDTIEMSQQNGEAGSSCQDEIEPADQSVGPVKKQTKAKRKRQRRNKTGCRASETLCAPGDILANGKAQNKDHTEEARADTGLRHSPKMKNDNNHHRQLQCPFCGRSFRHISAFTVHKRIHAGEKPYRCPGCCKAFGQRSQLNAHSQIHSEPQTVRCPCCSQGFKHNDELIIHFQMHMKDVQNNKDTTGGIGANTDSSILSVGGKSLKCSICFKEFINKTAFKTHQQMHRRVKWHTCSVCGAKFHKSSSLQAHERTHWPVKPYACSLCGKAFAKLLELKSHSQMHLGAATFFCAECNEAFSSLASWRSHRFSKVCSDKQNISEGNRDTAGFLVTERDEGQTRTSSFYKCPLCKQRHRFWCHLVLHLQSHASSQSNLCEECRRQKDKPLEKVTHCSVCCKASGEEKVCGSEVSEVWQEAETAQSPEIKNHILRPESEQKCPTLNSSQVETREKEVRDFRSPSPSCPPVNDDFSVPSPGFNHEYSGPASYQETRSVQPFRFGPYSLVQRHCGRYSCSHCGKAFTSWNKLWLHRPLHRQTRRPFPCTQCHLEFRFLGSYVDHLQEHASHRPYACPVCPDAFAKEENLSIHIAKCHKSHNSMKCSTCGKTFSVLTNLKKHELLHRGSSSHLCLRCNLSFPSDGALRTHVETHRTRLNVPQPTGVIEPFLFPFQCRKCTSKFTSTDLLHAHQVCHFTMGEKPASPPRTVTSQLPTQVKSTPGDVTQAPQRKQAFRVSNIKNLFRYPHPDLLYVTPSERPVSVSDTEEDCRDTSSINTSTSKASSSAFVGNHSCSETISNTLQVSSVSTSMDIDEPEPTLCGSVSESGPLHHLPLVSSEKSPPRDQETSQDVNVSAIDNDPVKPAEVVMKCEWTEPLNQSYNCAVCMENFTDIGKLHEHYMEHARGMEAQVKKGF